MQTVTQSEHISDCSKPEPFTDEDFDELREIITGARNGKPWDHDRIKELWSKLNDQAFQ